MSTAVDPSKAKTAQIPGHQKLDSLQALRGLAAIIVVFSHAADAYVQRYDSVLWGGFFASGWSGVDIFFVLSGFIIYYIHAKDLGTPSRSVDFVKKRAIRIYPLFWATVLFKFVLQSFRDAGPKLSAEQCLVAATLWPVPTRLQVGRSWTLFHEMFFYVLFGFGILTSSTVLWVISGAWITLIAVAQVLHYSTENAFLGTLISVHNIGFFLGVLVAIAYKKGKIFYSTPIACIGVASYLVLFANPIAHNPPDACVFAFIVIAAVILYGLLGLEAANKLRVPSWALFFGDASYSIYLVHTFAISMAFGLLHGSSTQPPSSLLVLVIPVAAVAIGSVVYVVFERPVLEFLRTRFFPKKIQANPSVAA